LGGGSRKINLLFGEGPEKLTCSWERVQKKIYKYSIMIFCRVTNLSRKGFKTPFQHFEGE
jgi:hypothetical protein